MNLKLHDEIIIPEMTNIVDIDNFTQTDQEELYNNLSNNQAIINFINDISVVQ